MRVEPTVVGTAKRFERNEGDHACRMSLTCVAGEGRMWNNIVPMAERSHEESMEGWGVFVRIVELQSFSAAARSLQMAKASVSRTMARLEERLGVPLVQRTTRSLSLTEAGEVLFARARLILDNVREAEEEARAFEERCALRPRWVSLLLTWRRISRAFLLRTRAFASRSRLKIA